jgi:hypothetical protein
MIAHQVSVQKSRMKPPPMWAGDFQLTVLLAVSR